MTGHYRFEGTQMKSWSVQDAKARFSEFLENCLRDGPQLVKSAVPTRRFSFRLMPGSSYNGPRDPC